MGKADLHIHTTASDGSCEPAEIVELASSKLLNTISITDHDTIQGYLEARDAARIHSVRLIPGVEFTALKNQKEIHVLAYDFDSGHAGINPLLKKQRVARVKRMERILEYLRKQGIDLSVEEVKAQARSNSIGRPHLAQLLVKKKMVASVAEAFIRYLGAPLLENIDVEYAGIDEIIKTVREACGVTVLAHPALLYTMSEIQVLLDEGLDGIECIHPGHSFDDQKKFTGLAEEKQLLVTGGSDFHGTGKKYNPWFGTVTLSDRRVNRLRRLSGQRRKLKKETE